MNDPNTFGLLFESLVIRDLRIYASSLGGAVFHYRDSNGLEADAVIHMRYGRWAAFEVKLGDSWVDIGAESLKKLRTKAFDGGMSAPVFLAVVVPTGYAYTRPDGVHVIPIVCLRDLSSSFLDSEPPYVRRPPCIRRIGASILWQASYNRVILIDYHMAV